MKSFSGHLVEESKKGIQNKLVSAGMARHSKSERVEIFFILGTTCLPGPYSDFVILASKRDKTSFLNKGSSKIYPENDFILTPKKSYNYLQYLYSDRLGWFWAIISFEVFCSFYEYIWG